MTNLAKEVKEYYIRAYEYIAQNEILNQDFCMEKLAILKEVARMIEHADVVQQIIQHTESHARGHLGNSK